MPNIVFFRKVEFLIGKTKDGADYDLKNNPQSPFSNFQINENKIQPYYKGKPFQVPDFGNYNFGLACRALGIPLTFAIMGAGAYQLYQNPKDVELNPQGFFDQKRDTEMIKMGYNHKLF